MNTTHADRKSNKKSLSSFIERLIHRIFDEKNPKQKKVKEKKPRSEFTSFFLCLGIFAPLCALFLPVFILLFTGEYSLTDPLDLIEGYADTFTKTLGGLCPALLPLGLWSLLLGLIRFVFRKKTDRHCITKSTALSAGIGLCASVGLYGAICALISFITQTAHNRHPLDIRAGILLMIASLIGLIVCLCRYITFRAKRFTVTGLCFDLLTAFICANALFPLGSVANHALSVLAKLLEL